MKTALLNICVVAIGISLFKMLVPNNSFNKQMNFLITCFFIVSIIAAFSNSQINLSAITEGGGVSYIDFSEQAAADRKHRIAEEMSARVKTVLEPLGIIPKEIYIIVNISGGTSISINEIKLVLSADDDFQQAADAVSEEVGEGVKVSIEIA